MPILTKLKSLARVEGAHSWNSAIKSDEQVESSSLSDPIDDEATRGLSDGAARDLSPD